MKQSNNVHSGHRQRVKNRFIQNGFEQFEDHNIIELLLFFGIPYKDTNEIAHNLINEFGSVKGVMDADIEQLVKIKDISLHTATLIKLTKELAKKYASDKIEKVVKIESVDDIVKIIMRKFIYADHEMLGIVGIDSGYNFKGFEIISNGNINATEVSIPLAVETALKKKWTNIILCHNHPSGSLLPSNADVATTFSVKQAMNLVNINLIDHIIVNDFDYVSMASSKAYNKCFNK